MSERQIYDIVIIGGGLAGLTAGARASELGLTTCVLEKGDAERYLCNTRYTGGTLHICLRDIMSAAGELQAAIDSVTYHATSAALAEVIAVDGRRVVRWLQGQGVRFIKASPAAYHNWVLAPPRPARPGLDWQGRGGDVSMRTLGDLIVKRGGKLIRGARATELRMVDGRCVGLRAEVAGAAIDFDAAAVVIADGGFQGNMDLVGEHISPAPQRLKQRGAATGIGDGLLMARAAGAQLTDLDSFYGHVLSRDAMSNDKLWPYPVLDTVVMAGIVVNQQGLRCIDEGEGGVYAANAIARLEDPLGAFAIVDHATWNQAGKRDLIPPNPHVPNGGGTVLQAGSIESLAALAGIAAAPLSATVAAYNQAAAQQDGGQLNPPRRFDRYQTGPISQPPFYAIPLSAGITYTMGGIAVNADGAVLDTRGSAIEGLYAAGSSVGGIDGGPKAGYVGGLVKAGVLGLRSAEHAALALGKSVAR